jgi:hypothetical protein
VILKHFDHIVIAPFRKTRRSLRCLTVALSQAKAMKSLRPDASLSTPADIMRHSVHVF